MGSAPFAFIIHPINVKQDVSRKFPLLGKILTENQINNLSKHFPPIYISEINGIRSAFNSVVAKGWFIACPFTPAMMVSQSVEAVYGKIVKCGEMAERMGAGIIGLGAYTSVVGDGGLTIADRLRIPVTNGNAYTIYVAIQAIRKAADEMGISLREASAAVVGATGSIGKVCSEILAEEVGELVLVGRDSASVQEAGKRCEGKGAVIKTGCDVSAIYSSKLIITVTSQVSAVVQPEHLRAGGGST